jgi:hypothetical protein
MRDRLGHLERYHTKRSAGSYWFGFLADLFIYWMKRVSLWIYWTMVLIVEVNVINLSRLITVKTR